MAHCVCFTRPHSTIHTPHPCAPHAQFPAPHSNLYTSPRYTLATCSAPHFALTTLHFTLRTPNSASQFTPHALYFALCTQPPALAQLKFCILHFALSAPHWAHPCSTPCTPHIHTPHPTCTPSAFFNPHPTFHTLHFHCALPTPHCTFHTLYAHSSETRTLRCTLCTSHSKLYTLNCKLHSPHFTLSALHTLDSSHKERVQSATGSGASVGSW